MQSDSSDEDNLSTEPDDDAELFRQQMQDVAPLTPDNRVRLKTPARHVRKQPAVEPAGDENRFTDTVIEQNVPEILAFSRSGVQQNTLKKLRQGKLPIDDRIDLHGMTAEQARSYLLQFLAECRQSQARVVVIVHGKGYRSRNNIPVIKALLNRWLRESPEVLAFHSAKPGDGGSGALYVLLAKE